MDQYRAVIVQPQMVYCSAYKAMDGTHFVRHLISSDLAHEDHNSIMTDWPYRSHILVW